MDVLVLLCDRSWNVARVLRDTFGFGIAAKDNLRERVDAQQAHVLADASELECGHPLVVTVQLHGIAGEVPLFALPYHEHFLAVIARVDSQQGFEEFAAELARWIAWADDNLPVPYQDGYYRIQRMNNRLINIERALAKKGHELEQTLAEVYNANSVIALLERDRLTGLYTAAGFLRHAKERQAELGKCRYDVAVFSVRGLRQVKELYGLQTGDDLLRDVALVASGLPGITEALLARVDSEVFFAFAPSGGALADVLQEGLSAYLADYPLATRLQPIVGVCAENDAAAPVEEACNRARLAFESARENGTELAFYDNTLLKSLLRQHRILNSVPVAIAQGQFRLYLQSKVNMASGKVVGAEALIRWVHPTFGFISPGDFIPLLEQKGRIYEVDRYIWEQACKIQRARADAGLPTLPISVNVARGDFYEKDLVDVLQDMLARYGLGPEALRLEVLERSYASDSGELAAKLATLRAAGFVIEMDDFGTGESTLAMLSEMPIDVLKLDRGFVMNGLDDPRRRIVVESIVTMAHRLNMTVIVEGVETREQEHYLLEMGCRYAQGFLYAKPQPADYFLHV